MRHVALILYTLVMTTLYAEVRVNVPQKPLGAEFDQQSKKWKLDKDVEMEDVATQLLTEAVNCSNTLKFCLDDKVCRARLEAVAKAAQEKAQAEAKKAEKKDEKK